MTIKPQYLLRFLLLFPYFAWGIALLFILLFTGPLDNSDAPNAVFEALGVVATVYTIGIALWGIPYTILAVGLFLWSLHKPASSMYKAFLFSPLLLSILMIIEVAAVSFLSLHTMSSNVLSDFLSYLLIVVVPSLGFGYVFVGVGAIIYKAMRRLDLVKAETEPSQA